MTFTRPNPANLRIENISELYLEMLRTATTFTEDSCPEIRERFLPSPGSDDPDLAEDWALHVQPGLSDTFLSARETLAADLEKAVPQGEHHTLTIPISHADAWINALNQARLALAIIHEFTEKELAVPPPPVMKTAEHFARLQMDFFAVLQEWILWEQEAPKG